MIKDKKWLTIFTIIIAIGICITLMIFSNMYTSNNNELVFQQNQSALLFAMMIAIFWLVIFLFYKIIRVEDLTSQNQVLLKELLEHQKNDFYETNIKMQNNRDILLKLYLDDKNKNVGINKSLGGSDGE